MAGGGWGAGKGVPAKEALLKRRGSRKGGSNPGGGGTREQGPLQRRGYHGRWYQEMGITSEEGGKCVVIWNLFRKKIRYQII